MIEREDKGMTQRWGKRKSEQREKNRKGSGKKE